MHVAVSRAVRAASCPRLNEVCQAVDVFFGRLQRKNCKGEGEGEDVCCVRHCGDMRSPRLPVQEICLASVSSPCTLDGSVLFLRVISC